MSATINIPPPGSYSPPSITDYLQAPKVGMVPRAKDGSSFNQMLQKAMLPPDVEIEFSKQAKEQMQSRGITLNVDDLVKLDKAINKAETKGAREALIMLNGNAFVVDVNDRTIINAMNRNEVKSHVFTKLDSAILEP